MSTPGVAALLAAKQVIAPQLADGFVYFVSDLAGSLSLYRMAAREGGSFPDPLLPDDVALQNPQFVDNLVVVLPKLDSIMVLTDDDGGECFQPMLVPLTGGTPTPAFPGRFDGRRVQCSLVDRERGIVYLQVDGDGDGDDAESAAYQADLGSRQLRRVASSRWGAMVVGANADHTRLVWMENYGVADAVYYLWDAATDESSLLAGVPMAERAAGQDVALTGFDDCFFTPEDRGLIFPTSLFSDSFGIAYIALDGSGRPEPVEIVGERHRGPGEVERLRALGNCRYALSYNINGASWLYEGHFNESARRLTLDKVICGVGSLADGVLAGHHYEPGTETWVLSHSSATSPSQLYLVQGPQRKVRRLTDIRPVGWPSSAYARCEDATFTSHDGLVVPARLYLPPAMAEAGQPYPLVYYVHGGPQGQARPDFAWTSMALIQYMAMCGFAVFTPNARGSSGNGLDYMKRVDNDWGGLDRLDHVHAMTEVLPGDKRLDVGRAAVIGRSYGGFMALTLGFRHPELWSAVVDICGPFDLVSWINGLPDPWQSFLKLSVGDPEHDLGFLLERSPKTYAASLTAPLMVVQGENDPRVPAQESAALVQSLRQLGKTVEYVVIAGEGHDFNRRDNRVSAYEGIVAFLTTHLGTPHAGPIR